MSDMRSRRVHERFECDLDATAICGEQQFIVRVRDISLGGMLLVSPEPLAYGAQLRLELRIPGLKRDSELEAIVRWSGDVGTGIQFLKIRAYEVWGLNQLFRAALDAA